MMKAQPDPIANFKLQRSMLGVIGLKMLLSLKKTVPNIPQQLIPISNMLCHGSIADLTLLIRTYGRWIPSIDNLEWSVL
jgi:hypothetical protein